jgi:hypothetical protein
MMREVPVEGRVEWCEGLWEKDKEVGEWLERVRSSGIKDEVEKTSALLRIE